MNIIMFLNLGEAEGAKSISLSSCSATLLKCTSISLCDNCVGYQVHWTRNGIRVSNSQVSFVLSALGKKCKGDPRVYLYPRHVWLV